MPVCNRYTTAYIQRMLFYIWTCHKLNIEPESSYLTSICSKIYWSNKDHLDDIFVKRLQLEYSILTTIRESAELKEFKEQEIIRLTRQYHDMLQLLIVLNIPILHIPDSEEDSILPTYLEDIRSVDALICTNLNNIEYKSYLLTVQ